MKLVSIRGQRNYTEIMGYESDRGWFIEKKDVHGPPSRDYAEFVCHTQSWGFLVELGKRYGWVQLGAKRQVIPGVTPADASIADQDSYTPGTFEYSAIVSWRDSRRWRAALKRAIVAYGAKLDRILVDSFQPSVYIVEGMPISDMYGINRPVDMQFVIEFMNFLKGGSFEFHIEEWP